MDLQRRNWAVLARIPDLNAGANGVADEEAGEALPASTGRLIKQTLSFRLLVGTALFLLVAAIIPFIFGRKAPSADPSSAANPVTAWHCASGSASAGTSPAETMPLAPLAPTRPVAVISASPERSRPPAIISPPPETKVASRPDRAAHDPLMSRWPRRPSEYEADRRAGNRPDDSNSPSKK